MSEKMPRRVTVPPKPTAPTGSYGNTGGPVSEGATPALCEMMALMRKDMTDLSRIAKETSQVNKEVLKFLQNLTTSMKSLEDKVEKLGERGDAGLEKLQSAMSTLQESTSMMVQASMIAAFAATGGDKTVLQNAINFASNLENMKCLESEATNKSIGNLSSNA